MKDNGSVIHADAGTTITISLDGNPTTGFEWMLDKADQNIIQQIQSKFIKNESIAVGTGGTYIFTATLVKTGSTELSLIYRRRWEDDGSVIKRFEITVNII